MVIVCPSCATEYDLESYRVGASGRSVRCAQCRTSWFVAPADDSAESASQGQGAGAAVVIEEGDAHRGAPPSRPGKRPPRDRREPEGSRAVSRWNLVAAAACTLTIAVALAGIAMRVPLVRAVPASASLFAAAGLPVNVLGLTIADVASGVQSEAGRRVLVTDGTIANATRHDVHLPDIEITVEGRAGETLYQWSAKPPAPELAAGETTRFSVSLASPPPDGARVLVAFRAKGAGPTVASR